MSIHAQRGQQLDPLQYFLDLSRGILGRRFPPSQLCTVLPFWCGCVTAARRCANNGGSTPFDDGTGEPRFVLTDRLDDHRPQITIAQHDQSMLVKPATCKLQQPLPIARARQFTAQSPHQRTPLGLR
jgi:hypothetical protein